MHFIFNLILWLSYLPRYYFPICSFRLSYNHWHCTKDIIMITLRSLCFSIFHMSWGTFGWRKPHMDQWYSSSCCESNRTGSRQSPCMLKHLEKYWPSVNKFEYIFTISNYLLQGCVVLGQIQLEFEWHSGWPVLTGSRRRKKTRCFSLSNIMFFLCRPECHSVPSWIWLTYNT